MKSTIPGLILFSLLTSCAVKKELPPPVLTPRINHVFLSVSNIDSSIGFYTRAFDIQLTNRLTNLKIETQDSSYDRATKIAFLKFPGQDFVLELYEQPASTVISPAPHLLQHFGVEVKDIYVAFNRLITAGGKLAVPIRIIRTNNLEIKQAHFRGPDGEHIELVQVLKGGY